MPKRHSPLDEPLARAASKIAGFDVRAGQVEDWRQAGVLEMLKSGDRPREYTFEYAPGSDALAAAIARVMEEDRQAGRVPTLDEAVLVAFVQGHNPKERGLRAAYKSMYVHIGIGSMEPKRVIGKASNLSRRASKHALTRALKEHVERPGDLRNVLENIAAVNYGMSSEFSPQTAQAIAGMFGVPEAEREAFTKHVNAPGPTFIQYAQTVEEAPYGELLVGRDLAVIFVECMRPFMALAASELGFEITIPEDVPDIYSEVLTAIAWVPHMLIRRRERGEKAYDRNMRRFQKMVAKGLPEPQGGA